MNVKELNSLPARYRALSDGALLQLFQERDQLTEEAIAALEGELGRRGIDASAEITLAVPDEEHPDEEQKIDDGNPLPSVEPQELPEDFFDDKDDDAAASIASTRPRGVTVIAFFCWGGAFVSLFVAFTALGASLYSAVVLNTAVAIFQFITGVALFHMRRWSRYAAIVLFGLNVVFAALLIASAAILRLRGGDPDPLQAIWMFVYFLYSGLILNYLVSNPVHRTGIWK